ncbi:MAG: TIGR00269 family protein [Thermoproteota archaeon]|nr:TIGR00269 family protein [Thermoproteota archaeon]
MNSLVLQTCNKCNKNNAIYKRYYSGELLCKPCFLRSIEHKVKKTISRFSMIKYGELVAVAVSGGKDSLTLLYILSQIFKLNDLGNLIAITVDEGIDGYRDESLKIVKEFCSKLKVKSKTVSYKELFGTGMDEAMKLRKSEKISSCSMCGTFRRRALDMLAESCSADVIATAHNLDDHIQTFFINMISGDVERIGWTYPEPVEYGSSAIKKIKPFLGLYEQEIIFYALHRKIPFQSEECPYMNESIRSDVRIFLNNLEASHPGVKYSMYNSVLKISEGLKNRTIKKSVRCLVCQRNSTGSFCSVCKTVNMLSGKNEYDKYC